MELPNLNMYRDNFIKEGINLPLPTVPSCQDGILSKLPSSDNSKLGWPWTEESKVLSFNSDKQISWPKLSIVMPSYNQGNYIEETIRSVLLQNYPNLEFIVCDGGSNDETLEVLDKYSQWFSFCQSKKDRGQGHAINIGFSLASGDYFGWINSDDFYTPNCFYKIAQKFLEINCDFIYGDALNLNNLNSNINYWSAPWVIDRYLRFGGIIATHAAFWKSCVHKPIWEILNCNIDGELWFRLLPNISKYHLSEPLGVARYHLESKTARANTDYQNLWEEDGTNIGKAHHLSPPSKLLRYEFKIVQYLYKLINQNQTVASKNYYPNQDWE